MESTLDRDELLGVSTTGHGATTGLEYRDAQGLKGMIHRNTALLKREVVDHDKFDIDRLQEIDGLQSMKSDLQLKLQSALGVWILFNSISTIMIILTNVRRRVDPADRDDFGRTSFDALFGFVTYFPLVFFLLLYLVFNNYYSEMTFYMYLKRGAIIDFPPSANPKALLTSIYPLVFLLFAIGYLLVTLVTLFKFKASYGAIGIFLNNVLVGVGYTWYKLQSIEDKFVSLSNFIQAFPDRDAGYGNMDEQSLSSACVYLQNMTLTETEKPSYNGYMRQFFWRTKNYSMVWQVLLHVLVFVVIAACIGMCVGYFLVLGRFDMQSVWEQELSPCVDSCTDTLQYANVSVTGPLCKRCLCACMKEMRQRDDNVADKCSEYISTKMCNANCVSSFDDQCKGF